MNITESENTRLILILGSPRSGTTWLGKIFDSHPDVLYRHEPDLIYREPRLQRIFEKSEFAEHLNIGREYVEQLISTNDLKVAGSLPAFRKNYYPRAAHYSRLSLILSLLLLGRVSGRAGRCRIPDWVNPARANDVRLVIKSIASEGRARLLIEAMPGCRLIYIIRDPYGHVASMRRGMRTGKFERGIPLDECLATAQAAQYGLSRQIFASLPEIEQLTWHWALLNQKAIEDIAGLSNAMTITYQDLCVDPVSRVKTLFDFTGLSWNGQTENFIQASTTSNAPDRYYQVFKNTADTMNKWRGQLSREEQMRIMNIARATPLWAFCRHMEI